LGKEAAMACTEAVEEVISAHYNDQLREVIEYSPEDAELREVRECYNFVPYANGVGT
jgi:demethoxyubiquinone hydroxylase (CLK1/Coq7/Cat5 family)